jgi:hypothetical protein
MYYPKPLLLIALHTPTIIEPRHRQEDEEIVRQSCPNDLIATDCLNQNDRAR